MRQAASAYRLPAASRAVHVLGASIRRQQLVLFMRAAMVGGVISLALVAYAALGRGYM